MRAALVFALILASLAAVPLLAGTGTIYFVTLILVWGIFAISFDLVFGLTGLLSFGHAAFFGTGAFVYAFTMLAMPDQFLLADPWRDRGRKSPGADIWRARGAAVRHLFFLDDARHRRTGVLCRFLSDAGADRRRGRHRGRAAADIAGLQFQRRHELLLSCPLGLHAHRDNGRGSQAIAIRQSAERHSAQRDPSRANRFQRQTLQDHHLRGLGSAQRPRRRPVGVLDHVRQPAVPALEHVRRRRDHDPMGGRSAPCSGRSSAWRHTRS